MSPRKRSTGDGGLWKRKSDGMWIGTIEYKSGDGVRRQKRVYSKNRNECVRKKDEAQKEIDAGIVPNTASTTVHVWLRYWVDKIKKPKVKPKTYDWYEESVRLHITPNIDPKKRLKYLTAQDIRDMLDKIETSGNRQRAHKTIKMALEAAVGDRVIAHNPAENVDRPGHVKKARGSLGADSAKRAIRAAIDVQESRDETAPLLATRYATGILVGARPAELLGLELDRLNLTDEPMVRQDAPLLPARSFDLSWQLQQLDHAHGCGEPVGTDDKGKPLWPCGKKRASFCPGARWDFNDDFVYRECIGSLVWTKPKSAAGTRIVPLMPVLLAMLQQHLVDTAHQPNPHGLVWHRADGYPITRHDDGDEWRKVLAVAELPACDPYTGRHTTGTLLQELGVPAEVRMAIMGQSSAAAHAEYIHVDQTQTRAALGKLERALLSEI